MNTRGRYDAWWLRVPAPCVTCTQGDSADAMAVRAQGPSFFPMRNYGPDRNDVPVRYLLVAMEPSGGWFERVVKEGKDPKAARNFGATKAKQDAPLQFAAREWLCDRTETFLLTDMAKCAVRDTKAAPAARTQRFRWDNCASILQHEAGLFDLRAVIAVGTSKVWPELRTRPWVGIGRLFSVLHFSQQAAGSRKRILSSDEERDVDEPTIERFRAFVRERRSAVRKAQGRPDSEEAVTVGKGSKVLLAVYRKQFGCIKQAVENPAYDCGRRGTESCCKAVPRQKINQ